MLDILRTDFLGSSTGPSNALERFANPYEAAPGLGCMPGGPDADTAPSSPPGDPGAQDPDSDRVDRVVIVIGAALILAIAILVTLSVLRVAKFPWLA